MSMIERLKTRAAVAKTSICNEGVSKEIENKLLKNITESFPTVELGANDVDVLGTKCRTISRGNEKIGICVADLRCMEEHFSVSGTYDVPHEILAISNTKGGVLHIDCIRYGGGSVGKYYLKDDDGKVCEGSFGCSSSKMGDLTTNNDNLAFLYHRVKKNDAVKGFLDKYVVLSDDERNACKNQKLSEQINKARIFIDNFTR